MNMRNTVKQLLVILHSVLLLLPVMPAFYIAADPRYAEVFYKLAWGGLLLLIPAAASRLLEKRIRHLGLILLADGLLAAGMAALALSVGRLLFVKPMEAYGFAIGITAETFLYAVSAVHLRFEKWRAQRAAREMDTDWTPSLPLLEKPWMLFLLYFAAIYAAGLLFACRQAANIAVVCAACYYTVCFLYIHLDRTDTYLALLSDMSHVPGRRIRRIGAAMALLPALLGLLALLPAAATSGLRPYTDLRTVQFGGEFDYEAFLAQEPSMTQDMDELLPIEEEEKNRPLPAYVVWIGYGILALCLLFVISRLIKNARVSFARFREAYDETGDEITQLDDEEARRINRSSKKETLSGPQGAVRREYKKRIRKARKEPPLPYETPEEMEKLAGIDDPDLHNRYERARYGA